MLENPLPIQPVFAPGVPTSSAVPSASPGDVLARLSCATGSFNIILTFQPRGSIPTSLWGSSYVVFGDSL